MHLTGPLANCILNKSHGEDREGFIKVIGGGVAFTVVGAVGAKDSLSPAAIPKLPPPKKGASKQICGDLLGLLETSTSCNCHPEAVLDIEPPVRGPRFLACSTKAQEGSVIHE